MKLDHTEESLSAIRLTPEFKTKYLALQKTVGASRARKAKMEAVRIETAKARDELTSLLDKILSSPNNINTDNIVRASKLRGRIKEREEEWVGLRRDHESKKTYQIGELESELIFIVFGHLSDLDVEFELVVNLESWRVRKNKNEPGSLSRTPRCDQ